ncbi:hypothetical protein LOTGIDRAFT_166703 [Lottia gigantea]|uniref:G-protein coupled receptors family 1 profile domain-containing protein n=1 Tax=Lottia gigantea TaxID=225164 RepID=V3Z803_LOTGI|nr:hypothetical protein LOTGIDRAFT_166703 [Lottia gigantea]ESO86968.1 hypothetical protein LOTGIDRAFT_166703 [Lottia gigantea]
MIPNFTESFNISDYDDPGMNATNNVTERFYNYPTAVYNTLLLSTGCIGNTLVLIVYGLRLKASSFNTFIVFLAMMDLICCAIEMPLDVLNMTYSEMIYGCKAIVSIATTTATATGLTLVAIAALRYRGICHPLKPNISIKQARIIVFCSFIFALCTSWPSAVIVTEQIEPLMFEDDVFYVVNCAPENRFKDTLYPVIYNGILFLIFISAFSSIVILYLIIARSLWLRKKHGISSHNKKQGSTGSNNILLTSKSGSSNNDSVNSSKSETSPNKTAHKSTENKRQKLKGQGMFKMLFIVTLVFLLSYLPHLSLMVTELVAGKFKLTKVTESLVGIFIRSYLINSACNPIIYGCYSKKFRTEIMSLFKKTK